MFEYLSQEAKEALLKAMAQEDVAELLNNMAPDDRTVFLEELPAEATRQLLALLTPAERAVALTLLGYPEKSVGRLMTPHYVAVREQWTVREVLDYVRAHGQDSETLNVIYVVDEQGLLIDDIRIREFLLAPLDQPRRRPDGSPVRRAEGHRRSGGRGRRVPPVRSQRAAGHRYGRHADRHRHHRRRAGRGRSDGDARDPADRRLGGPGRALHAASPSGG